MRTFPIIASLVIATALAVPAVAQPASDTPVPAQHQSKGPKAKDGRKGHSGQRFVEALRRIGVDDARIQRIVAIHAKHATERQQQRAEVKQHRDTLRALVEQGSKDEAAYQRALDGLEKAREAQTHSREAEHREVAKVLKPSERAKLMVEKQRRGKRAAHATPGQRRGQQAARPGAQGPRRERGPVGRQQARGPRAGNEPGAPQRSDIRG